MFTCYRNHACILHCFWATVHKTVHPMLLDHCLSVCPFVLSCGQMVAWTMPIGMELGHGPGHIALDGNPAPIPKGAQPSPIFGPCLLWPIGWIDQDATCYGGRPRLRLHYVRWGPTLLPQKRGTAPIFTPISIVVKRLDGSRCLSV